VQGLRDLGVGQPPGDQGQDLALAVGDACQGRGGLLAGFRTSGEFGDEPPGDGRGEQRVAGGDDPDRGEQGGGRGVLQQEAAGSGLQGGQFVRPAHKHRGSHAKAHEPHDLSAPDKPPVFSRRSSSSAAGNRVRLAAAERLALRPPRRCR
jgi:hypothetical protein